MYLFVVYSAVFLFLFFFSVLFPVLCLGNKSDGRDVMNQ